MWDQTKTFIEKHKYKIATGVGVLAFGCWFYKSIMD